MTERRAPVVVYQEREGCGERGGAQEVREQDCAELREAQAKRAAVRRGTA